MNALYNLGISLYSLAVKVAALRNRKARLMAEGQAQTFARLAAEIDSTASYMDTRVVARRI